MKVPFVDLAAMHEEVREDLDAAWRSALDSSIFSLGPAVPSFETAFAAFCGTRHAIGLSNGTDALELGLRAMGVGPHDLVVTVPNTFIATCEAIVQLGAEPRFVDVDPITHNMDRRELAAYFEGCDRDSSGRLIEVKSGRRVAAVIPVDLFGLPAEMNDINRICGEAGVPVLEDACQAHGAGYRVGDGTWKRAGTLGRAGCFSFYPAKNLGALGDAGALITDDDDLAAQVRILRDHGQSERYVHVSSEGVNARLDSIQAAVLEIKLRRLEDWNEGRRRAAAWYAQDLAGSGIDMPVEPDGTRHVYHLYVVRVDNRDRIREQLSELGIGTGLHYPIPLHLQPGLAHLGIARGTFPASERDGSHGLSLPMFPHITREQVAHVAGALKDAVG